MDDLVDILSRKVDRPYDIPLNVAVWISFKPIIKIYLSIGTGFVLAKMNVLTPELSKGISRLVLLIFMPCLLFNNIVTQIKDTDIKIFGVIVFSGFIYYTIGLGWGLIIRLISPIPRAWFGGLILCCMLNNCSDLPLAYVQTIGNSPLLPANVAQRGMSYCVLIVIIFIIFTFNLGGTRLVEWDATRVDPDRELPTVPPVSWTAIKQLYRKMVHKDSSHNNKDIEQEAAAASATSATSAGAAAAAAATSDTSTTEEKHDTSNRSVTTNPSKLSPNEIGSSTSIDHESHVPYSYSDHMAYLERSRTSETQLRARAERPYGSTDVFYARRPSVFSDEEYEDAQSAFVVGPDAPIAFQNMGRRLTQSDANSMTTSARGAGANSSTSGGQLPPSENPPSSSKEDSKKKANKRGKFRSSWENFKKKWFKFKSKNRLTVFICDFCEDLFLPQMMALISGITVAMIPWVRRVFVKGQNIHHFHDAPDQMPPLSFLMDFLSFFAGAQVPLGLMLLGATIASLRIGRMVPGFWKTLVLIVLFKLALLPIIACAWIHRIREIGWIDKNDPIVPIVLAVAAGTPSATVQIYLTLSWIDPTKESLELNCLAVSLMAQYALLPITMTFLMTYVVMHYV